MGLGLSEIGVQSNWKFYKCSAQTKYGSLITIQSLSTVYLRTHSMNAVKRWRAWDIEWTRSWGFSTITRPNSLSSFSNNSCPIQLQAVEVKMAVWSKPHLWNCQCKRRNRNLWRQGSQIWKMIRCLSRSASAWVDRSKLTLKSCIRPFGWETPSI